jgi:hypothetical protein
MFVHANHATCVKNTFLSSTEVVELKNIKPDCVACKAEKFEIFKFKIWNTHGNRPYYGLMGM